MLKKSLIALSLATPLLFSQTTLAEGRDFGQIYVECGLGGLIGSGIKDDQTSKTMAIITNVTWDLGTTAVSSEATTPGSCANSRGAVAAFINQSYDAIEKDLASGHGEYLDTLKVLTQGGEDFNTELRAAFAQQVAQSEFVEMTHYQKSEALYNLVAETI